jgi:hypothetical protein
MQSQVIMSAGPYKLISYGNGTAYTLESHCGLGPTGVLSVFVQGDDATQFKAELDQWEAIHPNMATRDILGELFCESFDHGSIEQ